MSDVRHDETRPGEEDHLAATRKKIQLPGHQRGGGTHIDQVNGSRAGNL